MNNCSNSIAVVGAGLTGLTAAHRLVQLGRRVRVFELADRPGGMIRSERDGGWLVEAGPNSLRETSPEITQLVTSLGLDPVKTVARPEAKHRYLVRAGRLLAVPASPSELLGSKLLSFGTKARLAAELLRRPRPRVADLSLAALAREHFGQELVDYAVSPIVSGVYAGDPAKLSARHAFPSLWTMEQTHGSLLRGQAAQARARRTAGHLSPTPVFAFSDGLATLPRALAAALPGGSLEFGAEVAHLQPGPPWQLTWHRGGVAHTEEFERVVLALPAAALARLIIGPGGARPLAALGEIEHASLTSFFLGYARSQITHPLDGFGLLVPAVEKRSVLGVIFSSTVFAGRAPAGHIALTVLVGGTLRPDLATLAPAALLPLVQRELAGLLGVEGDPVFERHHAWPHAIPQYNLGYERYLGAITRCEQACSGLFIGGHVRDGIGLSDCLASGLRLADMAMADEILPQ